MGATHEASDPRCGGPVRQTVWYRFSRQRSRHDPGLVPERRPARRRRLGLPGRRRAAQALRCEASDAKGHARFVFETHPRKKTTASFLLLVSQRVNSDAGKFKVAVAAPDRPQNDELAGAIAVGTLPATVSGSTLGATRDIGDPGCASGGGTVWYRFHRGVDGRLVMRLQAGADLEAVVCVVEKVRSQLRPVTSRRTDDHGTASFDFDGTKNADYYVVVSQTPASEPGPFKATLIAPEKPPVPPGVLLSEHGGRGHLDPLQNPSDAWSVAMARGKTYRFGVLGTNDRCVSVEIYPTTTRSFDDEVPVATTDCGDTWFFTPGPDGGGTYPVLVSVGDEPTGYRLLIRPAKPDDIGPGALLSSGERRSESVSAEDPLDLYRFDVPGTSDVRVMVEANKDLGIRLLNASGDSIQSGERGVELARVLSTGTYYVAVTPGEHSARYHVRALVRQVTQTAITASGTSSAKVKPGATVAVRTATTPSPRSRDDPHPGRLLRRRDARVGVPQVVGRRARRVVLLRPGRRRQLASAGHVPRHTDGEPEPLGVRTDPGRDALSRRRRPAPAGRRRRRARPSGSRDPERDRGVPPPVARPPRSAGEPVCRADELAAGAGAGRVTGIGHHHELGTRPRPPELPGVRERRPQVEPSVDEDGPVFPRARRRREAGHRPRAMRSRGRSGSRSARRRARSRGPGSDRRGPRAEASPASPTPTGTTLGRARLISGSRSCRSRWQASTTSGSPSSIRSAARRRAHSSGKKRRARPGRPSRTRRAARS